MGPLLFFSLHTFDWADLPGLNPRIQLGSLVGTRYFGMTPGCLLGVSGKSGATSRVSNFAALVGLVVSPSFVGSFDIAFVRCVTCQVYLNREGLIGPYGMVPPPVVSWC
jgi:hypothetical protein